MDFCVSVMPLSMSDADQMFHEPKCPCFSSLVCVAGGDIFALELNEIGEDTSFKEISPPQLVMVLDKQMIFFPEGMDLQLIALLSRLSDVGNLRRELRCQDLYGLCASILPIRPPLHEKGPFYSYPGT